MTDQSIQKNRLDLAKLARIPLWIIPLLIALLFFQLRGVATSPDAAWYTTIGLNLYRGLGYVNSDGSPFTYRGPVFPGLLALSFGLFGVSLQSALWVVRFFFVLNVLLIYAIGTRLFNRATGLIASLLVLTALVIHQNVSVILLDSIMPFFVLLAHLLLFLAFEQQRRLYFGLAGFLLGIAFLTKSTAGVFFPLPLLLWLAIPAYRKPIRATWPGLLLLYGVLAVVLLPWFLYLLNSSEEPFHQLRLGLLVVLDPVLPPGWGITGANSAAGQLAASVSLGQRFADFWSLLVLYFQRDFARPIALAPLFLVAWGYVSFRAIFKQSRPEILLISGLLLFSFLIPIQARVDFGTRHNFYLYLLSYLALARLLWPAQIHWPYATVFKLIGVATALAVQIGVGRSALFQLLTEADAVGYVPAANVYAPSFGRAGWEERGIHDRAVKDTAQWLLDHTVPSDSILIDQQLGNGLYFYLGARQPVYHMPYLESRETTRSYLDKPDPILFLWSYQDRTNPNDQRAFVSAVSEPQLLNRINELGIKYVLVTGRFGFVALYFRSHPSFEEVRHFGGDQATAITIFKVRGPVVPVASFAADAFEMHVGQGLPTLLARMRQENPAQYEAVTQGYLQETLGLSPLAIEQIQSSRYPLVNTRYQVTMIDDYARLAWSRGPAAVERALVNQQEKIKLAPDNAWAYATTGALYRVGTRAEHSQRRQLAIEWYEQALSLEPVPELEAYTRTRLGELYLAQGESNVALNHLLEAIKLEPSSAEAYFRLAQVYQAQGNELRETEAWQRVISLKPADSRMGWYSYVNLGDIYHRQGRLEQAAEMYQSALALNREVESLVIKLAQVCHYQGQLYEREWQIEPALALYARFLKVRPDDAYFNARVTHLRQLFELENTFSPDPTLLRHRQEMEQAVAEQAMVASVLYLGGSPAVVTNGDSLYALAETGQKVAINGQAHLSAGLTPGSKALVINETTTITGPVSSINLSQGAVAVWARLTDLDSPYSTLIRLNHNEDLWLYRYTYNESEGGYIVVYYNGAQLGNSAWPITDDDWHYYVFTWQAGEQRLYIDGVPALSGQASPNSIETRQFAIGWLGNQPGMEWQGELTDLTTFNRPLTEAEVGALYRLSLAKRNGPL